MRRVVITGMGIYSCIGKNQDEVKDSLFQGRSGIGIDPARKEMGYFSALTGLVERPDLKKLLDRKKRHSLAEQGEYAYMATLEAFRQAQIDEEFLLDHEVGILYGNDSSAAPVIEAIDCHSCQEEYGYGGLRFYLPVHELYDYHEPFGYFPFEGN